MILKKIIFIAFLFLSMASYSQNKNRPFQSIEIIKIAQKNGKIVKFARIEIDNEGNIQLKERKKGKIDLNTFTESINNLVENGENIVKVDGDDDKRTGFQEPYNRQHFFMTIIYQDDYERESYVNKTCYRYRETDLPVNQNEYAFFKYLMKADLNKIKKLLK